MKMIKHYFLLLVLAISVVSYAQDESDLAKTAQNPVGDLISLPLQNNTSFGLGSYDRTQNVLNIQPVYPIKAGKFNLITRTIFPIITQPDVASETGSTTGLGDINFTTFLSPGSPGKFIWGIGPTISIPTATSDIPGFGRWAFGPSVIALTISGPWVAGVLTSNIWSMGGESDKPDVNFFLLQYFINYNMEGGSYLVSAPIITNNWEVDDSLILPFGGGIGKILRLGKLPINANLQAYYNVVTPEGGPKWSTRIQVQFMFPK